MDKILILKKYMGEGVEDALFPNAENPIEIGAFRYDAKRMGGAPTISASVNYPSCLDDEWTDNVYAEFNGEKYYLKQTPTSSYDNTDTMYRHDIELVSERVILDNVYFFDAVEGMGSEVSIANKLPQSNEWQLFGNIDPTKAYSKLVARYYDGSMVGVFEPVPLDTDIRIVSGPPIDLKIESDTGNIYLLDRYNYFSSLGLHLTFMSAHYADKPLSNSTKVVFFGNIREFASRMNASLAKSGVGYDIVVDEEITTEEKLMSFEDQFFSNVLQEIYNTYEVPYYFDGKTIHIGYSKGAEIPTFAYGVDDALLSITKNNANYKIVNRATATGSSDNIPFYYPNNSPKGDIAVETNREELQVNIRDYEKFSNKVGIDDTLQYEGIPLVTIESVVHKNGGVVSSGMSQNVSCGYLGFTDEYKMIISSRGNTEVILSVDSFANFSEYYGFASSIAIFQSNIRLFANGKQVYGNNGEYTIDAKEGENLVSVYIDYKFNYGSHKSTFTGDAGINYAIENIDTNYWYLDGKQVRLADLGIEIAEGCEAQHGDTITQRLVKYVKTSKNLMPSIYRETDGDERFYNAINGTYADENGEAIEFANPYVEGKPKEHIFTVDDIKPSIEGMEYNGQRIDMFEAFAYDDDDNDETYEDEKGNVYFKHPYFFAKLKPLGFNLFDHAIEQQPMTISFTSGNCGACNFEIGVSDEFPNKNPVLVNADGTLKRDSNGRVICGQFQKIKESELQDRQQDTINNEVWIALKKEEDTYGILMPKAIIYEKDEDGNIVYDENGEAVVKEAGHRPKAARNEDGTPNNEGDTFVILGIHLPKSYIINAEKKLEDEIIKYLKENNDEKFTFSIGFSRVYFAENPSVLESLSENSKVTITYNNKPYDLYVSSFSYTMSEGDSLPEIRIELDDTLKVSQNALQNAISEVKSQLGKAIGNIDVVGAASPYFVRKDIDDEVRGNINFTKGVRFGEGGKVEIQEDNSAKLSIEYLEVTKKATFTSLEIQEKTHAGGQILVTPAAINCGEVVEYDDYYRCYFQTKGADGDEIFNQFAVNDQAICQTFNAWGSRYYWRLVVGVGEDYIDLSKTDCDENSDIPAIGDKIIQMGNRNDKARQNAIVIAAYGNGSPYIIQYKGINSFEIGDDKIVTKLSSTENVFTGKVHMEFGSDGLDQLPEWEEVSNGYQSTKYLRDALDGATEFYGGLALTEQIQVGDYNKETKQFEKFSGGMNGAYNNDDDVAFWAGGDFQQAIEAVLKYENDPSYQPTQEELASMANFVVTHGGRAILNDAIIRGTIYAKDGEFTGTIESTDGHIGGFQISDNRIGIDQGGTNNGMFLYDSLIGFRENGSSYNSFTAVGENVLAAESGTIGLARFELDGSKDSYNQYMAGYGLIVDVKGYGNQYAVYCPNGVFAGLRYNTKVIKTTDKYTLTKYDHTIVVDVDSGTGQIELPKNPEQGQRYEIYTTVASMDLKVYMNGQHEMYNLIDAIKFAANEVETYTADKRRHITIFFAGGMWFSDYRYLEK